MSEIKVIANNKKANHDYFIEDTYEAGIELTGTEIKSVRKGGVNLKDSYATIRNGQCFINNMHISVYEQGNRFNHDPLRRRRLLLHKEEIIKLKYKIERDGYTLVPLKVYIKRGYAKILLGIGKGKKNYDKRQTLKQKDMQRQIEKSLKHR